MLAAIAPRPAAPAPRRGLTAATVIASIVPDADAVLMPFGWDRYLLWHQRGTHALIGTIADAIVFALLLRVLLDVWSRARSRRSGPLSEGAGVYPLSPMSGRGQGEGPSARLTHLALAAWLGCLGHVLLDSISGGTIRLFAPFSIAPYGVPWMAMADPLIAVPLAIFLLAAWRWRRPEQVTRFAWITLIILATLVGVKEVSRRAAMDAYARAVWGQPGEHSPSVGPPALESAWASFTRWFAFDRAFRRGQLRVFEVDAWHGTVRLLFSREDTLPSGSNTEALLMASHQLETVRHLHQLFDLTFTEIRPHQGDAGKHDGLVDVLWSDIRFCWPTGCALWFGGTFDASTGALREQVVLVGSIRQTRPP